MGVASEIVSLVPDLLAGPAIEVHVRCRKGERIFNVTCFGVNTQHQRVEAENC